MIGDPAADTLLSEDPFALLLGMLLDQQIAMETAFAGPAKIRDRIGTLDPATIARFDPDAFLEAFRTSPAVHRFPGSMAARMQDVAGIIARDWNGDAASLWTTGSPTGTEILRRLKALPGFGDQKARIYLALLGKRLGVQAEGWREAAALYTRSPPARATVSGCTGWTHSCVWTSPGAQRATADSPDWGSQAIRVRA